MHCVGNKFDVRVSTASTSVFAKRLFKGKPLQQQAKVVNGCMIGGFQVTGALLNITVVSRGKKVKNVYQSGASQIAKALGEQNIES